MEADNAFVDATCMWMVKNPEYFDVIVTSNMFGDIITDLGAMIQGGMGIAAGGNINPGKISMFEPIHGSAPKYKGLKKANPIAAILSHKMTPLEKYSVNWALAINWNDRPAILTAAPLVVDRSK